MTDINLESCVDRTFERDGERFTVIAAYPCCVVIEDDDSTYDIPHSVMKAWLASAVEVDGEK